MKTWNFKRFAAIGAVLLFGLFLFVALRPQPQPVDALVIGRGNLRVSIDEEGETRVRDRYVVSSPLAARVLRIELEPGDLVVAGGVLVTLKPVDSSLLDPRSLAEAQGRVKAAEASLASAKAARDEASAERRYADADLLRIAKLHADAIVSKDQLDEATLRADTRREAQRAADFAVGTAQHQLEVARAALRSPGDERQGSDRLAPIEIRAPIGGVVLRRLRESEAVVAPGEPLLELGAPGDIEVVADLLSTDAVKVRPGSRVLIEQWGGDSPLEGRVRRVEPSGFTKISALGVEEQRVNVVIDIESPREQWVSLGDGYRVEVRILVWEKDEVLKVPTSALFRRGEDWAVFAIVRGKAEERKIEIGQRNGLEAELIAGLAAGDQVVVHPSDQIDTGVKVELRGATH